MRRPNVQGVNGFCVIEKPVTAVARFQVDRQFDPVRRLDSSLMWFKIDSQPMPPSSSGLGYLVLSQGTGVRVPVGVLDMAHRGYEPRKCTSLGRSIAATLDLVGGFFVE